MEITTIISKSDILNAFYYEVVDNKESYNGKTDIHSILKDSFTMKKPIVSKTEFHDLNKNNILSIYRLYKTPINSEISIIITQKGQYTIKEDTGFKIPSMYIELEDGNIEFSGTVFSGDFNIKYKNHNIAHIKSANKKNSKEYSIYYNKEYKIFLMLFIAMIVTIDSKYHYY